MGAIKNVARKVVNGAEKTAKWIGDHWWDMIELAGYGLAGYGLGAFVCDVTGLTDWAYDQTRKQGHAEGYAVGFAEGQRTAAELIATANGATTPASVDPAK